MTGGIVTRGGNLRRPLIWVGLSTFAVILLCASAMMPARLVWNLTASAPPGIYFVSSDGWSVGDRVVIQPLPSLAADLDSRGVLSRGKLLIKRVAAGKGDEVCRRNATVTVNNDVTAVAMSASGTGQALPGWAGCRRLAENEVFLLGETASSFDGRYFGFTPAEAIIGRAVLVVAF